MRIIGGSLKGKKLFQPIDQDTRPLKDIVKESIFNILQHSVDNKVNLFNSNVLDLFSGTGSFGLECLSRGARKVTFFENHLNSIFGGTWYRHLFLGLETSVRFQCDSF